MSKLIKGCWYIFLNLAIGEIEQISGQKRNMLRKSKVIESIRLKAYF